MKKRIAGIITAAALLASLIPAAYAEPEDVPAVGVDTADEAVEVITDEAGAAEAAETAELSYADEKESAELLDGELYAMNFDDVPTGVLVSLGTTTTEVYTGIAGLNFKVGSRSGGGEAATKAEVVASKGTDGSNALLLNNSRYANSGRGPHFTVDAPSTTDMYKISMMVMPDAAGTQALGIGTMDAAGTSYALTMGEWNLVELYISKVDGEFALAINGSVTTKGTLLGTPAFYGNNAENSGAIYFDDIVETAITEIPDVDPTPTTEPTSSPFPHGTCGDNLTWVLDDEGTLTISGSGDMGGYYGDAPWYLGRSSIKNVILTESVTSIGKKAFYDCSGLESVTIPESVTSIGREAFYGCSGLTSVTIPESVTSIGGWAFYECSGLDSVYITDMAKYLSIDFGNWSANPMCYADKLYLNNRRVTKVEIPDGVTKVPVCAFDGCDSITSVTIPESVTSIGESAFYDCGGLTSVTIPESVTSIGRSAFRGCGGLTSVTIPESVTSIGEYAFSGCSGLTSVTIPESVTSIGERAFYDCSGLTSVTIPEMFHA